MIRLSTILPVIVGLVAAVFAVVAGMKYMEDRIAEHKVAPLVPLVVAKAEIPYGVAIADDMLVTIEINKKWSSLKGSHTDSKELVDRVASTRIVAGMPVTDGVLAPVGTAPGAENQIPIGFSPVSVLVKTHTVQTLDPGNHVDVMHTAGKGYARGAQQQISRYILQNVEVFAVGARRVGAERPVETTDSSKKKKRRTTPPVRKNYKGETAVTLLVHRDDVMKLTSLASSGRGEITLLLRRAGDNTVYANPVSVDEAELGEEEDDSHPDVALTPPPLPAPKDVEVWIGGKRQMKKTFVNRQLFTGQGGAPTAMQADRSSIDEESRPKPLPPLGE